MKIYESNFQTIEFYQQLSLMKQKWNVTSKKLDDYIYQTEMKNMIACIVEYCPQFFLADTQHLQSLISPEMQAWTNENINIHIHELGIKKTAFVNGEMNKVENNLTNMRRNYVGNSPKVAYFEFEQEAEKWLKH
jgi:hypothetical protein